MGSSSKTDLNQLLKKWEEVYKRGLLSFWLLISLDRARSYPYEMPGEIEQASLGTISVNGNSVYRALRKFEQLGLVMSEMESSTQGPPRRYYTLTTNGRSLLRDFIRRNILVFSTPPVIELLDQFLDEGTVPEAA